MPECRPWWAPGIKGLIAICTICGAFGLTIIRMFHPNTSDDKILDMMIVVLFSTCVAMVYSYYFGNSQRATQQDAQQAKVVENLMTRPTSITVPVADAAATTVITQPAEEKKA